MYTSLSSEVNKQFLIMTANRLRTAVYIDGYNWYHAIFKHHPELKWLNIQSFFTSLRPHEDVISIKMFSAIVDPENLASDARERQERYFKALRTLPKVKIILGSFQERQVTCRANGCRYSYWEEKKTDVNIAIEVMADVVNKSYDSIAVVSGDSDVQPVLEWVSKNHPDVKITAYIPALKNEQASRRLDYYRTRNLNIDCKFLPLDGLPHHQLPNIVKLDGGKVSVRPHVWSKASN